MATKADGTIIINTKINTDGINEGVEETKKALSFGDIIKGSAIGSAITGLIQSVVSQVGEMGAALIDSAATVKAEGSQFEQTFQDLEGTAREAISGVADNAGILETRLNTLGSQIYAFARSSGGSTAESMDLMERSLQAAADGAAYYDRSLEDTTDTLQSFLKGNFENDAALGVSATETTRNAKAMELFGEKYNDLTEIQKQQTLLQMVLDAQELSGAMGQAAREADGWENVQGNLNESVRQFQAAAGQPFLAALVPIVQGLTKNITNLTANADWDAFGKGIESLVNSFKEEGFTGFLNTATEIGVKFIDNIAKGIAGNVTSLINMGLPMLLSFSESLRTNAGKLVDSGLELILQVAKGLADGLPTMIKTIPQIVTNIAGIINDNAPKLLKTGLQLILTLGKGLLNAIPTIVANIPEILMAIVNVFTAFNWLNLGKNLITGLKNGITAMKASVKTTADSVKNNIYNAIKGLPSQLKSLGSNALSSMRTGISGMISSLKNTAGKVLTTVVNAIKSMPTKLANLAKDAVSKMKTKFTANWSSIGKNIINGIIGGITNAASNLYKNIKDMAKNALNSAKTALGIHSPSREFRDIIGAMIPKGITEGLKDEFPNTIKALENQANAMIDTAGSLIPSAFEYFMPVMATGTVVPSSMGFTSQYGQFESLRNEIDGLKNLLLQKQGTEQTTNNIHVTAQVNRRVLFDEVIEEGKLRRNQTGDNPFDL